MRKLSENCVCVCVFFSQGDAVQQRASGPRCEPGRALAQLQYLQPADWDRLQVNTVHSVTHAEDMSHVASKQWKFYLLLSWVNQPPSCLPVRQLKFDSRHVWSCSRTSFHSLLTSHLMTPRKFKPQATRSNAPLPWVKLQITQLNKIQQSSFEK